MILLIILKSVVLPAPFGPKIPKILPVGTSKLTLSKAVWYVLYIA